MSRTIALWQSALIALQMISGGAVLGEFVEQRWIGLFVLVVGALQGATAFFLRAPKTEVPE